MVCYVDATVALPLITAYAMARRKARKPRRLYEQRERLMAEITAAYEVVRKKRLTRANRDKRLQLRVLINPRTARLFELTSRNDQDIRHLMRGGDD